RMRAIPPCRAGLLAYLDRALREVAPLKAAGCPWSIAAVDRDRVDRAAIVDAVKIGRVDDTFLDVAAGRIDHRQHRLIMIDAVLALALKCTLRGRIAEPCAAPDYHEMLRIQPERIEASLRQQERIGEFGASRIDRRQKSARPRQFARDVGHAALIG